MLFKFPRLKRLLEQHAAGKCYMHMGAIGASSLKPTFVGTAPWLPKLNVRASLGVRLRLLHTQMLKGLKVTKRYVDKPVPECAFRFNSQNMG